jgi:hypothetical protein
MCVPPGRHAGADVASGWSYRALVLGMFARYHKQLYAGGGKAPQLSVEQPHGPQRLRVQMREDTGDDIIRQRV